MRMLLLSACVTFAGAAAAVAADAPLVTVPRVAQAPTIDGQVSAAEWEGAAVTGAFRDVMAGYPAAAPVRASLCYDAQALYALFICEGEDPEKLLGGAAARDSAIWDDSEAELFLAAEAWPAERYAHFMVNHAGAFAEELCVSAVRDLAWNGEWQCAAGRLDGAWCAEMAIPWRTLDLSAPEPGTRLRANLARNAAAVQELSAWAPVRGGFHDPERFGTLVLSDRAAVAVAALPGRATGPAAIHARLIGTPQATLRAELRRGTRGQTQTLPLQADQPGVLNLELAGGTSELLVSVQEPQGRLLWHQSVRLDLPDLAAQVGRVRRALGRLQGSALAPDLAALRSRLAALETQARAPLDTAGLVRVGEEITAVEASIRDLRRLSGSARPGAALPAYYVAHPDTTEKIQPNAADPGPQAKTLRIAMARGEYEPVQIVVCAVRRELRGVRVTAGELRGPDGARIPGERVVVNPVGFVRCAKPGPGASLAGLIPDVLLPDRALEVPAGQRQPFFITVQTTAQDVPGEYHGHVRVTAEGEPATTLPLVVRVYPLTLPVKSHLRTAFVLWGSYRLKRAQK